MSQTMAGPNSWHELEAKYKQNIEALTESAEMATIEKEIAEEKLDNCERELNELKERLSEASNQNEALKKDLQTNQSVGTCSSEPTVTVYQLQKLEEQNEAFKQALIKVRDISTNNRKALEDLQIEHEKLQEKMLDLEEKEEKYLEQIKIYEEQIHVCHSALEMVEKLTQQKTELEDKLKPTNHSLSLASQQAANQANNAGSSRHSSASVSPSLGGRSASSASVSPSLGGHSARSTSAAQSPINQLGAPSNGLGINQAQLAAAAAASQQDQQSTVAAMAAASQFLSALARSQVGQLGDLDHLTQSQLLGTLNAAANPDVATNLSNHLPKQQNLSINNNNSSAINLNSASHPAHSRQLTPQTMAQQLAAVAAANSGLNSTSAAAAAAVAAQLSAASNRSLGGAAGGQPGGAGTGSTVPVVHSIPHPHSHHALSHPTASLLMNNPHYQTVRTKYSTRRYSRRRVGPDEAMADPNIRATVQLKMAVVPKTILIVLKHRLTVQTAITLACAHTGERLRKGAIQKKLEAMFREPGAVDSFLAEWDHPR